MTESLKYAIFKTPFLKRCFKLQGIMASRIEEFDEVILCHVRIYQGAVFLLL